MKRHISRQFSVGMENSNVDG
ncbi:unnamed protein product [Acanthoscelides obtectus]|uniref:Uncharacterized protein n=1 Tax=Acanthoscelides obtectus TaxID=200917 RepID=A0A9P0MCR2_ACAOB|nr:unnamed protein product [Acanthoscelides obtectus]CAK1657850.1 hypothetical protein AOBTE_LOCUS20570 [Acanthoscelides obtectus]